MKKTKSYRGKKPDLLYSFICFTNQPLCYETVPMYLRSKVRLRHYYRVSTLIILPVYFSMNICHTIIQASSSNSTSFSNLENPQSYLFCEVSHQLLPRESSLPICALCTIAIVTFGTQTSAHLKSYFQCDSNFLIFLGLESQGSQ